MELPKAITQKIVNKFISTTVYLCLDGQDYSDNDYHDDTSSVTNGTTNSVIKNMPTNAISNMFFP